MPSYYELIQVEVFYLFGRWKYLKPGRATCYPLLGHLLSMLLLLLPIGHVFTSVGRWAFRRVVRKYKTFILVSLGFWSDRAAVAYDIQRKVEIIAEGRDRDDDIAIGEHTDRGARSGLLVHDHDAADMVLAHQLGCFGYAFKPIHAHHFATANLADTHDDRPYRVSGQCQGRRLLAL